MFLFFSEIEYNSTPKYATVEPKMKQLEEDFSSLQGQLLEALDKKQISVGELKVFLTQLCADQKETIQYFDQKSAEMYVLTTNGEVFAFLTKIGAWTFLHYHLIEEVNTEFKLAQESMIASYEDKISKFMEETLLQDFLIVWNRTCGAYSYPGYEPVILKVQAEWSTYTLAWVADIEGYLAGEFKLKKLVFRLANGTFGCVYLMWLVPSCVAEYMRQVKDGPEWPEQLPHGIEELRIGWKVRLGLFYVNCNTITLKLDHNINYFFIKSELTAKLTMLMRAIVFVAACILT